jgi:adenylosuccinate lyase
MDMTLPKGAVQYETRFDHAIGHIADSQLFGNGYSTSEARAIFSDKRRMQRWLDVEVALALSQGELGMIPADAAAALAKSARVENIDLAAVAADIASSGHGLVPLLRAWQRVSDSEAQQYVHFGATAQDIHDTAQALEMVEALDVIERDLKAVAALLARQAKDNRDVVAVGRTHGQQALPTTLGLKFAVWLDETLRNVERLHVCRRSVAVAQLFGGVGTMGAFGADGPVLLTKFAQRLELGVPAVCWHVSRDRVAEFLSLLALISGGLANIANEVLQLAKSEIGELAEPFQVGMLGSSTMPHKRNPEISERVVVLAKLVKHDAGLGFDALCNEHERDFRSVRVEWVAVTDAVMYTAAALAMMKHVLSGLEINYDRISANLRQAAPRICSEALMFLLSDRIGKVAAYQAVYDAALAEASKNRSLVDVLLDNKEVARHFDRKALDEATRPEEHLGAAASLVDGVVMRAERILDPLRY